MGSPTMGPVNAAHDFRGALGLLSSGLIVTIREEELALAIDGFYSRECL